MKSIFYLFLLLTLHVNSQTTMENTPITFGDSTFIINHQFIDQDSSVLYLNIHEDEQTSIEAIRTFQEKKPVNFTFIEHTKTRRLHFNIRSKNYSFDPNRIYTRKGRRKTIEPNSLFSFKAKTFTTYFANQIINLVKSYDVVVTLHNNTDVNYSIKSYLPEQAESENTEDVFIDTSWDADDFIYTTEQKYFDYLKKEGVNVILQKQVGYVNDGSLSVYCGKANIKYINIEAQKGHLDDQIKLICIIDDMLLNLK